jgi:NAD(P)-dependent dehydrogenase (short-subunit alcohol dehydrogenase family)
MDLSNRAVLITGGRRIGAVVALDLARRGADVALSYNRSRTEAEETVTAIEGLGRRAVAIEADVSRPEGCRGLVAAVVAAFGRLDVLVNMASVYAPSPYDDLTELHWEANLNVDARAAFLCARAAVPHMREQGGGRIINFSDWLACSHRPRYKGFLPYYVAKAAVIGLTEALALELADDQILVNAIAPGPILAPAETTEDEHEAVEKATPLGQWGGGEEIAKVVAALVDSDFMTGEIVRVDGGRHIR